MNRIIVPLDGTELSERAIVLGVAFARAHSARLELVHVLEEPIAFDLMPSLLVPDRPAAERYLQRLVKALPGELDVATYVIRGEPVGELMKLTAHETDVMIVLSTHGRGGLGRIMLGSVADKVVRGAAVPVALVRGVVTPHQKTFKLVLVPLDGSPLSEEALPYAVQLAQDSGATLHLLRVCEPFWNSMYGMSVPELAYISDTQASEMEQESRDEARKYLDTVAERIRADGMTVVWEVRSGRPADEIIRAAETTDADLIVLSTHGRGGIRRWAFGSVTNEVLHRGTTPIMAIPAHVAEGHKLETVSVGTTN